MLGEEDILAVVAALGDVMWAADGYHAFGSCHTRIKCLDGGKVLTKSESGDCPFFPLSTSTRIDSSASGVSHASSCDFAEDSISFSADSIDSSEVMPVIKCKPQV